MIIHRDKYAVRDFFAYGSNAFINEMEIYTDLLDLAQLCGPHGFKNRLDFEYEWSAVTRYKPWSRIGVDDDSKLKEFSGMDYMVLHNLMYIALLVNKGQYGTDYISSWDPEVIKGYDVEFAGSVVNVLASWNFKHIVNLDKIRMYNSVNLKNGFSMIEIRTPREILKTKDDEKE